MAWLLLETCCFYVYVFAAVAYIAWMMLRGACETADPHSDRLKAITDFLTYASINLTWFALNFVLSIMAPICIFWLQSSELELEDKEGSYMPIMYTLWGIHFIAFVFKLRVYKYEPYNEKLSNDDDF